jgi:TonB-linked SusC/RagA family outer membrane protein
MKYNNLSYHKIRIILPVILLAFLALSVSGQVKKEKKVRQLVDITLKVTDSAGVPVSEAEVTVGEGITHAITDADGTVKFRGYPEDVVTINAFQFDKKVISVIDILKTNTVTLAQGKPYLTSRDDMPMPFTSVKKRYTTGQEALIPGSYFSHYPSTDIRNSLTGISSGYNVREMDGSPGLSPLEGLQDFQGISNDYGATNKFSNVPFVVVDDMPAWLQQLIVDPAEIESATLVKGIVGKVMYGPSASSGLMYITTKKGVKNERMLHVDMEDGVSVVDRMPGYVSGADYARLQNQARAADGLPEIYSQAAISAYEKNDGYDLQYPNTDFAGMMLDKTMEFRRVNVSSSGGNDNVQYFSYIGYAGEGDIINLGAKADYNRLTARQNVTVRINDQFTAQFGFVGNLSFRRSPNYGYDPDYSSEGTGNSTLGLLELPDILNDIRTVPPVASPIWAFYDTTSATPWYGVNALYTNNPIGNIVDQGFYTDKGRTGASNLKLTYDAGNLIKGLKATTYFGFNIHNLVRLGKSNDYLAYTVNPTTLAITKSNTHSLFKMADLYKLMDYYFQDYAVYEKISYDRSFTNSNLQSMLIYKQNLTYLNGIEEPFRFRSLGGSVIYSLKDKYIFNGVANYSGNSSFARDYRSRLNWAVGAGWVLTDEDFMPKSNFLNYFKLRAQFGITGNETYFPNLYDVDRWSFTSSTSTSTPYGFGPYTSSQWFGSSTETAVQRGYLSRTGSPALTWPTYKEFNFGFDAILFNKMLELEMTYVNYLSDGAISRVTYNMPLLAGYNGARPYVNYGATRTNAFRADLSFTEKMGKFILTVGANASVPFSKRIKYDEPEYRNDYQRRTGKMADPIFGYKYIGKFASDNEAQGANGTPLQLFDAQLHQGDLKYADLNSDGFIDENDQHIIGNSNPRLFYGLNVSLKYKNFDLFILGSGRAFCDVLLTSPYYWNGWGDNNYSNFVKDNIGGAYPRLTYYKVNNNFVVSDFWLANGAYFKIQNVELSYTIPSSALQLIRGRAVKIYLRGANLLTLTKVKDVDPETISSDGLWCAGVTTYPLFRTISGGIKLTF